MNKQSWDTYLAPLQQTAREFTLSNAGTLTDQQIVKTLKKSGFQTNEERVRHQRRQEGLVSSPLVAQSPFVRYDNPPTVEGNVAVFGDVELPFHEHNFLNRCLELCQKWKITKVVFNGDLLHQDSLSWFSPNWQEEGANTDGLSDAALRALQDVADDMPSKYRDLLLEKMEKLGPRVLPNPTSISEEWKYAREALKVMKKVFPDGATYIQGNHEGRYLSLLNSPLMPEDFKRILMGNDDWLKASVYYWGLVNSNGIIWRCTHPKNTSTTPASIAAKLADKFGMNIVQGHNHLWAVTQSMSGKYIAIESGCMVDGKRLSYYETRDTTRPQWQNGAVIIRDGFGYLLHPLWTDWERMMKNA